MMVALVCGAGQNITLQILIAVPAVICHHFHFKVGIILGPYFLAYILSTFSKFGPGPQLAAAKKIFILESWAPLPRVFLRAWFYSIDPIGVRGAGITIRRNPCSIIQSQADS